MSTLRKNCPLLLVAAIATSGLVACGGGGESNSDPAGAAQQRSNALAAANKVMIVLPRKYEHSTDHAELSKTLSAKGVDHDTGTCFKPNTDGAPLVVGCLAADVTSPITPQAAFCSPWLDAFSIPVAAESKARELGYQVVDLGPSWKEIPCPEKSQEPT